MPGDNEQRMPFVPLPPLSGLTFSPLIEFTIQPHPAKTNNPADLGQDPSQGSQGLVGSNPNALASTGPGIQVLTDEQARGLEKPKSREEVSCRAVFACAYSG